MTLSFGIFPYPPDMSGCMEKSKTQRFLHRLVCGSPVIQKFPKPRFPTFSLNIAAVIHPPLRPLVPPWPLVCHPESSWTKIMSCAPSKKLATRISLFWICAVKLQLTVHLNVWRRTEFFKAQEQNLSTKLCHPGEEFYLIFVLSLILGSERPPTYSAERSEPGHQTSTRINVKTL